MNPRIAVPVLSLIAFAVAMTITGVVVAPSDTWPNVLLSGYFLAGLGLAGGLLVAIHDASSGRWLGPVRSVAWSLTRLVLPGSIVVLAAITIGGSDLYVAWHPSTALGTGSHELHGGFKAFWLERTFFTVRAFVYVALWLLSLRLLKKRQAALYIVIFGVTVWLSSFDWIMALEPHWYSTIYGVYHFAGLFTAGLAAIAIVIAVRARNDETITTDHLHDVARLLFAFSTFWMYIWFSQAMLTWYTNIPEETAFYSRRAFGNWGVLFWAVVLLEWILPFLILLPESAKRSRSVVLRVAIAVLIGHWLDLYVAIVPAQTPEPQLTGWELALSLGTFAAVGWAVTKREREARLVPVPVTAAH